MLRKKTKHLLDPARLAQTADAYRSRVLAFCDQRLSILFEMAGPSLLGFVDVAGSDLAQSQFFAATAQLEDNQASITQGFQEAITQGVAHFFTHGRESPRPWLPRRELVGSDEEEIRTQAATDEAQAIKNLIIRTNARCFPDLYALSQRLAAITGGGKLRDDEIPAGPHHLAHSFRAAIAEEDFDIRVKVVLYALFHHSVTWSAATLYCELNDILRNAGILPKTRPVNLRRPHHQSTQLGAKLQHLPDPNDHQTMHQVLVGDLLELAASQRSMAADQSASATQAQDAAPLSAPHPAQQRSSAPSEDSALNGFLGNLIDTTEGARANPMPPGCRAERIRIDHLSKARQAVLDPELATTIEQMFGQMFDTPALPTVAKVALGQLQMPYLKAALNDIGLLRDPQHPARVLLDECIEAGSRWIDESDPNQGVAPLLREISERILDTPNDEAPPFAALLEHLQQHTRRLRQQHQRQLPERRCHHLQRDRRIARDARRQARGEILALLQPYTVPPQVRVFLETTWVELLTFVRQHREEGPDSPSWYEALDTARTLVELFDPRVTGAALRARLADLPRLRQRITNAAQRLGSYNRATLAAVDGLLANPHSLREQLRRAQALPSRPPTRQPSSFVHVVQAGFDSSLNASEDRLPQQESEEIPESALQAMIDELRKTKSGTWFELDSPFGDSGSGERRIQLSWISPLTSTYLFVDEVGAKTEMRGLKDLAKAMLSGRARVVPAPDAPHGLPPSPAPAARS